jgi:hypothetical protein
MNGPGRIRRRPVAIVAALVFVALIGLVGATGASSPDIASRRGVSGLTPVHVLGSDSLRLPTRLVVAGKELIVLDRYRREAVLSMDRRTGEVLRSFGRRGQGPAELWGPFAVVADSDGVVVLDVSMNRLTHLQPVPRARAYSVSDIRVLRTETPVVDIAPIENGRFLMLGLNPARPLALLDVDEGIEPLPRPLPPDRMHPKRIVEAMQGVLRAAPDRRHVVRTRRFASRIEILDGAGSLVAMALGPEHFDSAVSGAEIRFGYLDAVAYESGFVALYSGRTRASHPGEANYGSQIHAFNWDGGLEAVHHMDHDLIAIAGSEDDRLMYGIAHDPEPAILAYSLP